MKPFAATLRSGQNVLGFALSNEDLMRLKAGDPVVVDLSTIGVGVWAKEADGSRNFIQPRNSNVMVILGENAEDIGQALNVDLSSLKNE